MRHLGPSRPNIPLMRSRRPLCVQLHHFFDTPTRAWTDLEIERAQDQCHDNNEYPGGALRDRSDETALLKQADRALALTDRFPLYEGAPLYGAVAGATAGATATA